MKNQTFTKYIIALSAPLILTACNMGNMSTVKGKAGNIDFKKSQIIVNGKGIADNLTNFVVLVRLLNSDYTPVVGFTPSYSIVAGLGVNPSSCSVSDATGTSVCLLTTNQAGIRTMKVANVPLTSLQADVEFDPVAIGGKSPLAIVAASSQKGTGAGGWKIEASITDGSGQVNNTGAGGWKIQTSLQGAMATTH